MLLLSIVACFLLFAGSSDGNTECIQRDKNTREISKYLFCDEGCCGNELTYQYCCEDLNPDKMYTQYDYKKSWSPIHYFLIGLSMVVGLALTVTCVFCIIRCSRTDKRECGWI